MTGVGLLHGIHGQGADGVDTYLINVLLCLGHLMLQPTRRPWLSCMWPERPRSRTWLDAKIPAGPFEYSRASHARLEAPRPAARARTRSRASKALAPRAD